MASARTPPVRATGTPFEEQKCRKRRPGSAEPDVDSARTAAARGRPYLNTAQDAHYLGVGWRKLMRLRVAKEGPRFRRHGRLILYHPDDLDAWSLATSGRNE